MNRSLKWLISSACAMSLSACGTARPSVDAYQISGDFAGIAAFSDGSVVVGHWPDVAVAATLLRIDLETAEVSAVELDAPARCSSPDVLRPSRLPDGRLGALVRCPQSRGSVAVAIDVTDGGTEVLAELESTPGQVTWSPSLARAAAAFGSEICQSLAWISDDGELTPMELTVEAGGRSFALDDA